MGPGGPETFTQNLDVDSSSRNEAKVVESPVESPLKYLELSPEERPLLFSLTPVVIRHSIPLGIDGIRTDFQMNAEMTPKQVELVKKMKTAKLPSGIFKFSGEQSNISKPIGFLMEGNTPIELVGYEVQKKLRGLPETSEYSPTPLSFETLLSSIAQDGISLFSVEESQLLKDLEMVLLENNGLGIIDTVNILNNGGNNQSMRVRTESHTAEILNTLGLEPEQIVLIDKLLSRINKSIIENDSSVTVESGGLWSGKFVYVSSLEEPWKITPYSGGEDLSQEYMIDLIRTNIELALKFGQRPYMAKDIRQVFRITDSKGLLEFASQHIPEDLWKQRETLLSTMGVTSNEIVEYIVQNGIATQSELAKVFDCSQRAVSSRWADVLRDLPEDLRLQIQNRKSGFLDPELRTRNESNRRGERQVVEGNARSYLLENPHLLRLPKQEIFRRLQEYAPITMGSLKRILNHDPELSSEYLEGVYEQQVARGIENRSSQRREKGVNFAELKFDSAAEALTGFLIMNYTVNDALVEGENFQVNGQFDFRVKTKNGKQVIVEYHPEAMERIRDSNNQVYYSKRKEAQKKYGIEDTEVIVFDGFSSLKSTRELLRFIQSNLRLSKSIMQDVQVDTDDNISRLLNLARNGRGPYIPKDKYTDGEGRERYKYWCKPNAAIRYVLNNPEVLRQYFPDITLEDMNFFFRDHLIYSEEHKTIIEEIIRSYPEKTSLEVGEYILDDMYTHKVGKKMPLPKAS